MRLSQKSPGYSRKPEKGYRKIVTFELKIVRIEWNFFIDFVLIAWYNFTMILSENTIKYFRLIASKVTASMAQFQSDSPYFILHDPIINNYECLRKVWLNSISIREACDVHNISRSSYYQMEERFVKFGVPGLFSPPNGIGIGMGINQEPVLEQLVVMIKKSRPSIQNIAILRIAQAVADAQKTQNVDLELISKILNAHGLGYICLPDDEEFFGRIQRTLFQLNILTHKPIKGRKKKSRKACFFADSDPYHKRLECLRELFFSISHMAVNKKAEVNIKNICIKYNIATTSFYRLAKDYRLYGPWAVISAATVGKKDSISDELELEIIIKKLLHPPWSPQQIVDAAGLHCSRFVVNRIIKRWGLEDKNREPVALDRFMPIEKRTAESEEEKKFKPIKPAYHLLSPKNILQTQRINRHFELICNKMKTHAYHLCDPGPLVLAPFINDLGVIQAFETYGPAKLRGKEITNLALLNVFRILSGYRRINHLSNNRDRSVALASGVGLFGSSSKFYEDTIEFKFEQLHKMRLDVVARAKELGILEGLAVGFDFHFKEFYGSNAQEKGIGKGPNKSGDFVPGFRPHVAWDLAKNVIMSIAYYQGSVRSSTIIRQFCEQNIFPIFDCRAIEEIYMDSEYTKEGDFHYFKEVTCQNGDIYVCLKRNKQIKKFIEPCLKEVENWFSLRQSDDNNNTDEYKSINVILPKSKLPLSIVILRDRRTKGNIRCFGTTDTNLPALELLQKYRYRWIVENGLKDLVSSYFIDEIYGQDPERIEFEFYCVMVARLAYEYFLQQLGGKYLNKEDGNKFTLSSMRNLLFEKRNCTIRLNSEGDFELTILDSPQNELIRDVRDMLRALKEKGKNKVLWWNNRGIFLRSQNQFEI